MRLSMIIPVFNTAAYLPKCLDSCLHQDIPGNQYEIILVDDGSTDDSPQICRDYAKRNECIKFFAQENSGQGAARNFAIQQARGKYLWFIDSDDWIGENCLSRLLTQVENDTPEIIAFQGIEVTGGHSDAAPFPPEMPKNKISGAQYLMDFDPTTCSPLYLFQAAFLKNKQLSFPTGVFFEDEEFIFKALYVCASMDFLNECLYFISVRSDSTTRGSNPKAAHDLLTVAKHLSDFTETSVAPACRHIFHTRISILLNKSMLQTLSLDKENQEQLTTALRKYRELFRHLRKSGKFKDRIEGWLLTTTPGFELKVFKTLHRLF